MKRLLATIAAVGAALTLTVSVASADAFRPADYMRPAHAVHPDPFSSTSHGNVIRPLWGCQNAHCLV